jgi:hypothetical protein
MMLEHLHKSLPNDTRRTQDPNGKFAWHGCFEFYNSADSAEGPHSLLKKTRGIADFKVSRSPYA